MNLQALLNRAAFDRGVGRLAGLPEDEGAEVAFGGRSNAGKSSVINALTRRAALARISKTPGRTQQINFFTLDERRRLVDLPGYGYARAPESVKRQWGNLVEGYLSRRESLRGVVLIMDVRRPFMELDEQLLAWCVHRSLPVHLLLNKADKLSRGPGRQALAEAQRHLDRVHGAGEGRAVADVQLFSAAKREGLSELESCLARWLDFV